MSISPDELMSDSGERKPLDEWRKDRATMNRLLREKLAIANGSFEIVRRWTDAERNAAWPNRRAIEESLMRELSKELGGEYFCIATFVVQMADGSSRLAHSFGDASDPTAKEFFSVDPSFDAAGNC